jgi:hypothetical protein
VVVSPGAAVKANHAFRKGDLDAKAIEAIAGDVEKMMGEK